MKLKLTRANHTVNYKKRFEWKGEKRLSTTFLLWNSTASDCHAASLIFFHRTSLTAETTQHASSRSFLSQEKNSRSSEWLLATNFSRPPKKVFIFFRQYLLVSHCCMHWFVDSALPAQFEPRQKYLRLFIESSYSLRQVSCGLFFQQLRVL